MQNIRKMMKLAALGCFSGLALFDLPAYEWQTRGQGPAPGPAYYLTGKESWRMGGLCMEFDPRMTHLKRPEPPWSFPDFSSWMGPARSMADRFGAEHAALGRFLPEGAAPTPAGFGADNDWCRFTVMFNGNDGAPAGRMTISRVFPGVIIETVSSAIALFVGAEAVPRYFAMPLDEGVKTFDADMAENLEQTLINAILSPDWMLLWYGSETCIRASRAPYPVYNQGRKPFSPVDCPFLLVFEPGSLASLKFTETNAKQQAGSLIVSGNEPEFKIAVMPLYGDFLPLIEETKTWIGVNGIPEKAKNACQWWSERLCQVPITAREEYDYNAEKDLVTVKTTFEYERLREENGVLIAPLPPMLLTALQHELPMAFDADADSIRDTSVLTKFGPYRVVENAREHKYSLQGLSKYVFAVRNITGPVEKAPPRLLEMLRMEIEKILDAGRLRPWAAIQNGYKFPQNEFTLFTFGQPGDVQHILAEAYPLLDEPLQARVREFIEEETAAYPIDSAIFLPIDDGARRVWHASEDMGEYSRERLALIEKEISASNPHIINNMLPRVTAVYAERLSEFFGDDPAGTFAVIEAVLEPYLALNDWASMAWMQTPFATALTPIEGMGGVTDVNMHFAALCAAIRMARKTGAENENMYWGLLARTAIQRYAYAKLPEYYHEAGMIEYPERKDWMYFVPGNISYFYPTLYTGDFNGPADDLSQVGVLNQFGIDLRYWVGKGLLPYSWGLTPELARFLSDYLPAESRGWADRVTEAMPDWFVAMNQARLNKEHTHSHPDDSYYMFLLHAWTLRSAPERLAHYIDAPWLERGDLYYIHKLAETIKAYQGWEWEAEGEEAEKLRR